MNLLNAAREALARMNDELPFEKIETAWTQILNGYAIFTKIEQLSKENHTAKDWYNGIKKVKSKDPLLEYMRVARNSSEHSIQDISERKMKATSYFHVPQPVNASDKNIEVRIDLDSNGKPQFITADNKIVPSETKVVPTIWLLPVKDRNKRCPDDPPTSHLGAVIDSSPATVGRLYVNYLDKMISDAIKLGL